MMACMGPLSPAEVWWIWLGWGIGSRNHTSLLLAYRSIISSPGLGEFRVKTLCRLWPSVFSGAKFLSQTPFWNKFFNKVSVFIGLLNCEGHFWIIYFIFICFYFFIIAFRLASMDAAGIRVSIFLLLLLLSLLLLLYLLSLSCYCYYYCYHCHYCYYYCHYYHCSYGHHIIVTIIVVIVIVVIVIVILLLLLLLLCNYYHIIVVIVIIIIIVIVILILFLLLLLEVDHRSTFIDIVIVVSLFSVILWGIHQFFYVVS